MPSVRDVLSMKGGTVHSTPPHVTVLQAVELMNRNKIGALVVMSGERVVGMFTERDVLVRIVGEQRDAATTLVSDVMSDNVICCDPDADLEDVGATMKVRRVRHIPVCAGNGRLMGVISMGDLNACHASTQEATISYLSEYIYGRA